MRIPKTIHFIWAGGDTLLKPDYIDSMKLWANQNSEFAIWLWVDKKSAASEASWAATLEHYKLLPNRTELKDIEDCKDQLDLPLLNQTS